MDRLYSLTSLFFLCLYWASAAHAAGYCSLAVRVLSPGGKREVALVSVQEKSGRKIEKDLTARDVEFCDLGIAPVTVKVGADGTCNQIVIKDVPLHWQERYLLTVTYDLEPCLEDSPLPPVPICDVLLRVSDRNGNWLEKASVQIPGSQLAPRQTDKSGRALVVLKLNERVEGSISESGYQTKLFSISCSRSTPVLEELVQLEKTGGQQPN